MPYSGPELWRSRDALNLMQIRLTPLRPWLPEYNYWTQYIQVPGIAPEPAVGDVTAGLGIPASQITMTSLGSHARRHHSSCSASLHGLLNSAPPVSFSFVLRPNPFPSTADAVAASVFQSISTPCIRQYSFHYYAGPYASDVTLRQRCIIVIIMIRACTSGWRPKQYAVAVGLHLFTLFFVSDLVQ